MSYTPYYTNGWQSGESGGTPITPAALNHIDSGIAANDAANTAQDNKLKMMPMGGYANHTRIPSGSNLNNYTTVGTYVVNSDSIAANITNMPKAASGTLYVLDQGGSNYLTQLYIPNSAASMIYMRNFSGGNTWTSWCNLAAVNVIAQSKTTSSSGNFNHTLPRQSIVLQAWCNLSDTVVLPYPARNTGVGGTQDWWFHVQSVNGPAVASQTVDAVIAYIALV